MKLVDLNLLLYAVNSDTPEHGPAHAWWTETLADDESVGLAWVVLLGFVRISTHPRLFPSPLSAMAATGVVDAWLAHPGTVVVQPRRDHWRVVKGLLHDCGRAGKLTTDAHLAALAIEHGAELFTADNDFGRFDKLRWRNPLRSG